MKNFKVYMHELKSDNKRVYIGITSQKLSKRFSGGYKSHFANAIKKYGFDSFNHIVLFENLTEDEAIAKEKELIHSYRENGYYLYNKTDGGDGTVGHIKSEECIKKSSNSLREYYKTHESKCKGRCGELAPRYGMKNTEEHNRKISEANKGRKKTEKQINLTKKLLLEKKAGWFSVEGATPPMLGKTGSKNVKSKKVYVYDLNEKYVGEYESGNVASKILNVSQSGLSACCLGKLKQTKGYVFSYERR